MKFVSLTVLTVIAASISQVWTSGLDDDRLDRPHCDPKIGPRSKFDEFSIEEEYKKWQLAYETNSTQKEPEYDNNTNKIELHPLVRKEHVPNNTNNNNSERRLETFVEHKETSKDPMVAHAKFLVATFRGKLDNYSDEAAKDLKEIAHQAFYIGVQKTNVENLMTGLILGRLLFNKNGNNNNNNSEMSDDEVKEEILIEKGLKMTKAEIRYCKKDLERFMEQKGDLIKKKFELFNRERLFAKKAWENAPMELEKGLSDMINFVNESEYNKLEEQLVDEYNKEYLVMVEQVSNVILNMEK